MRIGITELILIIIVAVALIKPDKLIEYSKHIGEVFKTVKKEQKQVQNDIIEPLKDDIAAVKEPIDDIVQPINDIKDMIHK